MRKLIALLAFSHMLAAQPRENKPLPFFTSKPVKVLDEGITGWSYSLDGQWISSPMTIPVRTVSRNEDQYETHLNELGNDNIDQLQLYPILYGKDTLVMLVKIYDSGNYKLKHTAKRWNSYNLAYYYVFNKNQLKKLSVQDSNVQLATLDLLDYGQLKDVKNRHVLREIKKQMIIKPRKGRQLLFTMRKSSDDPKSLQFQFASKYENLPDVEGILHDLTVDGSSLYGSPELLDYIYYEVDATAFHNFFSLPSHIIFNDRD